MSQTGNGSGEPSGHRRRRSIVVTVLIALAIAFVCWKALGPPGGSIPFDRQTWLSYETNKDRNVRERMYFDLSKHYLKRGMTRDEVVKLLGKPEAEWRPRTYDYDLGPDSWDIDRMTLTIEFDESGRVTDFYYGQT